MRASIGRQPRGPGRRLLLAGVVLVAFGGLVAVTQVSSAETVEPSDTTSPAPSDSPSAPGNSQDGGLDVLGTSCEDSNLPAHTGFQDGNRCVSTAFGEVGPAEKNPTLLIIEAPRTVEAGQPFQLTVSTRNLVRDRFLPAAQGGYYLESSFLNDQGLVRGHFHTACRMLTSTAEAPDPAQAPAFFVATEDNQGGAEPDTVTIQVPGLPEEGIAQCAVWAGDGSHRIPMMQRANQIPALDAVRIRVTAAEQPKAKQPPAQQPPAKQPPAQQPPAKEPPAQQPPADQSGGERPSPPAGDNSGGSDEQRDQPTAPEPTKPGQSAGGDTSPDVEPSREPSGDKRLAAPNQNRDGTASTPSASAEPSAPADQANSDAASATGDEPPATGNVDTPAAADAEDGGAEKLALTGSRSIAVVIAGAAVLAAGMVLVFLARQGRSRGTRY